MGMDDAVHLFRMKIPLAIAPLLVLAASHAAAFTKNNTIYTTDGSQGDVQAAIANANVGDTVGVPAGTFTWGAKGSFVNVNKAIRLAGAGMDLTNINIDPTGAGYNGVCRIFSAGAVVQGMTFNSPTSRSSAAAFTVGGASGWRITNVRYNFNSAGAYFVYCSSYGLIDNCVINNPNAGNLELIFLRGPANSWQTPSSMGTDQAVYIEDCTFNAVGYVCDANANARVVIRNCTMTLEGLKIDGHGKASNTPPRGVRQVESYRNTWTQTSTDKFAVWFTHELRGGTGMIWGNSCADNSYFGRGLLRLTDYAITSNAWGNFGYTFQTPVNYPVDDQIGVGQDPKVGGSEPMYLWNNSKAGHPAAYSFPNGSGTALYQTQLGYATATTASAVVGVPFTYLFGASTSPAYQASNLPPGLSFTTSTAVPNALGISVGLISGTPTAAGTYTVNLSAQNQKDTCTAVLTLVVGNAASSLPQITSVVNQYAFVGAAFNYQLAGTNSPTSFAASSLPGGLSIDRSTGIISGTVTASAGNYLVPVAATNQNGTTNGVLSIRVLAPGTSNEPIINGVTYSVSDLIKADRDYFSQDVLTNAFDGSSGVGIGTFAQMNAITPTQTGVGYWVTDQGNWDANLPGASGQLYVWNGSAWAVKYVPYAYPHPLRTGVVALPAPQHLRRVK